MTNPAPPTASAMRSAGVSQVTISPPGDTRRDEVAPGGPTPNRLRAWITAADVRETEWGARRSALAKWASWSLVVALVIASYIARENLGSDGATWVLLTAANVLALAFAVAALRQARFPPIFYAGILVVFVLGGISQIYLLSYNLLRSPGFIVEQLPLHNVITPSDVSRAYGLVTLAFVTFCITATVLATIPVRTTIPRSSGIKRTGRLTSTLAWATIAYVVFTILQYLLGFGQAALLNKPLPFEFVTVTLFYRRDLYPAILLLGIWAYDRKNNRASYLCVAAIGVVAVTSSYVSTSRGTTIVLGLPILFLWILTGRFTSFRKLLVAGAFVSYLVAAPILTTERAERVAAQANTARSTGGDSSPLSADSLGYELGHFIFRTGGTGSLLFAMQNSDELSLESLWRVYRPSGLTSYFTHDVVGVPVRSDITSSQAPTVIGLGMLAGGPLGLVIVVALTVVALDLGGRWIVRHLWSWPVALSILAYSGVAFFSEGVPIQLYKSLLAIVAVEVIYRFVAPRRAQLHHAGQGVTR